MKNVVAAICVVVICFAIVFASVFYRATPTGRALWNNWFHAVQKADDSTNYKTRKLVEDTCRAMIASYNADKLTYEQYKDANSAEKLSWAEQAKMRANKTASSYNNYILTNSYLWQDNIPADIYAELPYIGGDTNE